MTSTFRHDLNIPNIDTRRSKSASGCGPPFADLDPLSKLSFQASFVLYLVTNSIWKLFFDVLFSDNTTFLNTDKEKQPCRSISAAFIIASRTVYVGIKYEQTTAFQLLKLL